MSQEEDARGWDCKFVQEPPSDLICLLCSFVAHDPQQVTCCGQIFCNSCLRQHKVSSQKCPNCSKHLNSFPDGRSDKQIRELPVHCSGYGIGCQWSGQLHNLGAHSSGCQFQVAKCPNQCSEVVYKKDLSNHTANHCPRRTYQCPHCRQLGTYRAITSVHIPQECSQVVVQCPNGCGAPSITKAQLPEHLDVCPNEETACSFGEVGCGEFVQRRSLPQHEASSQQQHLKQVALVIKSMKKNVDRIKQRLKQKSPVAVFKMPDFQEHKSKEKDWTSQAFYSHPDGYKLCINVEANGYEGGRGSHISLFVYIMKGEHDEHLPWPCKAHVCVELLNQLGDEGHHSYTIDLEEENATRVQRGETAENGYGPHRFIAHKDLHYSNATNTQYLKDDCLFFRVYTACDSVYKPWLGEFNSSV